MTTKSEKQSSSIKRGSIDFDLALPDFSIPDKDIAEIDASLARFEAGLPRLDFDFAELDELLGLGDLPDLPLDLPAIRSRDPGESPKNAHTRVMGSGGEGATKLKRVCGAKTRKGTPCKAPGNGRGGRCKLHGGKSKHSWVRQRISLCFLRSLPPNTHAYSGSKPGMGSISGHSRSTFSSGIAQPKPSQCGFAIHAEGHRR